MAMNTSINAVLILDSEGGRIAVKYYKTKELDDYKAQVEFEKKLFAKTHRTNARVDGE